MEQPTESGESRRPRLGWIAVGLAAVAAIVVWSTLTGSEPTPDDSEPTVPAPSDADGGAGSETDAGSSQAQHAPFTVTPAVGLAAMAEVRITVPTPYLTQGRPAMALCVAGVTFACTDLAATDLVIEATENSVTAVLPRRFTTRNGDIHDCAQDSPCELRLWVFDFRIEERNVSLEFADGPAAPGLAVEAHANDDGRLILDLADRSHKPLLCLAGLDRACTQLRALPVVDESASRDSDSDNADDAGGQTGGNTADPATDSTVETVGGRDRHDGSGSRPWRVAVEPADLVVTPRGPFSCVEHGGCEIRIVTGDSSFVEPLAVTLPRSPKVQAGQQAGEQIEEQPLFAVRPTHDLPHGGQAQILISNTTDTRAPLWLCAPQQRLCSALDVIATEQPVLLRLPRVLADRHGAAGPAGSAIDCAATACELRTIVGRRLMRQSLTFDTGPAPAEPELVVAEPGPFVDGQLIALQGRGFFGPVQPGEDRAATTIRLCEAPDAAPPECTSVLESLQGIGPGGRLDTVIRIPPSSAWRQTFDLDGLQRLYCEEACWLVVEEALQTPSAAVPIEITRRDDPRLP